MQSKQPLAFPSQIFKYSSVLVKLMILRLILVHICKAFTYLYGLDLCLSLLPNSELLEDKDGIQVA